MDDKKTVLLANLKGQYWYQILKILKSIINRNTKGRGWGKGWSVGWVEGSGEGLGCSQDSGEYST